MTDRLTQLPNGRWRLWRERPTLIEITDPLGTTVEWTNATDLTLHPDGRVRPFHNGDLVGQALPSALLLPSLGKRP